MTKEELIDRINDIEWEDFEAKEAKIGRASCRERV